MSESRLRLLEYIFFLCCLNCMKNLPLTALVTELLFTTASKKNCGHVWERSSALCQINISFPLSAVVFLARDLLLSHFFVLPLTLANFHTNNKSNGSFHWAGLHACIQPQSEDYVVDHCRACSQSLPYDSVLGCLLASSFPLHLPSPSSIHTFLSYHIDVLQFISLSASLILPLYAFTHNVTAHGTDVHLEHCSSW